MKFTFIIPPVLHGQRDVERVFGCSYGLYPIPNIFMLYGAATTRAQGADASFIDGPVLRWNRDKFKDYVKNGKDCVFVFYTVNLAKENDLIALDIIKTYNPDAWVIFSGPAPTYSPDDYLVKDRVIAIRGETEDTLAELVNILSNKAEYSNHGWFNKCKGISYRINGLITNNAKRDAIVDIDKLPMPARDLAEKGKYFNPKLGATPFTMLLTSRGCAFRCRYCVPNSLSFARELEFRKGTKSWHKPKAAIRSFENVYQELKSLKKDGYKAVSILDDQFVWDGEREIKIANAMGELNFAWGCLSRGDKITEDVARAFSFNNCKFVDVGIESFSQAILDDIGKATTVEKQYKGIELLKKYDVPVKLNILFGASPLETKETIKHTLDAVKKLNPYSIMVGICNPFPGTEFWEIAKEKGWLLHPEYHPVDVQKESTVEYDSLSKYELETMVKKADLEFFMRPKFILSNIAKMKNPAVLVKSAKALFKKLTNV